ncbi:hypothetical protein PPBDW_I21529 [Photobacterium kishitanii]|nr:hypothetical protein PPBDW_I21529 [Photobacterium kishitanii]
MIYLKRNITTKVNDNNNQYHKIDSKNNLYSGLFNIHILLFKNIK